MKDSYIEGDRLMRSCPVYPYDNIRKLETVITKEEFLMCYKVWVENKEESLPNQSIKEDR